MEDDEAVENDPILQKLRETKRRKAAKWLYNISTCLLNPDLLISQAFCIFFYGSFGAITPYLPLYLKKYNLTPYQVGIILGLSPIVQCLVSPVWMAVAGRWHAQKLVFLAGVLSLLVKLLLFLAVQPQKQYCLQSYVNSTTNLSYTRSMPYTDTMKEAEIKWTQVKPINKKQLKKTSKPTAASPARSASHDSAAVDNLDEEKLLNSWTISHTSRHLMTTNLLFLKSVSESTVVIKTSSRFDPTLNATVHYTITADKDEVYDIFLIFLLFTLVCDFLQGPTFGLGDGSVFNHLEDNFRSSPTKMHFTGSCGWAGTALIVGAIIYGSNALHCGSYGFTYYVAFYFSIGFVCMAFTNALWFEYIYETNTVDTGRNTWKRSFKIFCKPKNLVFLLCLVYISLCSGFLVPFLNWYIDDLGGSPLVVATVSATRVLVIFIFYQFGKIMVPILGKANVTVFALMCYTVCFFCYWLIKHTWVIVAIVVLEGVSFAFVWRCCDRFVSHVTVSENGASLTKGILLALFWGAGQGLGSIIGGALFGWLGRTTFRILGFVTIVILLILGAILCYIRPNTEEEEDEDFEIDDDDDVNQTKTINYGRYDDYSDEDDTLGEDTDKEVDPSNSYQNDEENNDTLGEDDDKEVNERSKDAIGEENDENIFKNSSQEDDQLKSEHINEKY